MRHKAVLAAAIAAALVSAPAGAALTDLATPFVGLWDATRGQPAHAQVAAFKQKIALGLPSFYTAEKFGGAAKYDARIASAFSGFAPLRDKFATKATSFRAALPARIAAFRRTFPDFRLTVPVYLLHSLGQMDGGTRDLPGGRTALIFGIDVMVAGHGSDDEAAFFDHELFHVYHARFFRECPQVWCSLWSEGLAVYVASHLEPGASERQLLLDQPPDMLAATKAGLGAALADLAAVLDSTDDATIASLFSGGTASGPLPRRRGYYLGMLVAAEIGRHRDLPALARLSPAEVRPLIAAAIHDLQQRAT